MMILQRNRHTPSPDRMLLLRMICRWRLVSRCQVCTTLARTDMKGSFHSPGGHSTQVVETLHSSNPPRIAKGHLEAIRQSCVVVKFCVFRRSAPHTNDGTISDA